MKIIFAVTGIGRGHSTRAEAIINKLPKDTEIIVAAFAESYEHFKKKYKTYKFYGLRALKDDIRFNIPKTFIKNIEMLWKLPQNTRKLEEIIKKEKPGLIVSDLEHYAIRAAKKQKIRCIAIFNYNPLLNTKLNSFISTEIQHRVISQIYRENKDSITFVSSLKKQKQKDKINFVPLILRKQPKELPKKEIIERRLKTKDPILVYAGETKYGITVERSTVELAKRRKENFIIFTSKKYKNLTGNIVTKPFQNNFLEYLKTAKGIISTAGHNTISEALVFKVPGIFFGIPNMLEQKAHLDFIEESKLGRASQKTEKEEIKKDINNFLRDRNKIKAKLKNINIESNGAEIIANKIKSLEL